MHLDDSSQGRTNLGINGKVCIAPGSMEGGKHGRGVGRARINHGNALRHQGLTKKTCAFAITFLKLAAKRMDPHHQRIQHTQQTSTHYQTGGRAPGPRVGWACGGWVARGRPPPRRLSAAFRATPGSPCAATPPPQAMGLAGYHQAPRQGTSPALY
jgi:hypothetical protein